MKRSALVCLAALVGLLAAQALAAALPLELNNTRWNFVGIQFNASAPVYPNVATGSLDSNGSYVSGGKLVDYPNGTGSLSGNLTLMDCYRAYSAKVLSPCASDGATGSCWNASSGQADPTGVAAPLTLSGWNADTGNGRFYMAPVDGYGTLVAVSENSTFGCANASANSTNGSMLAVLVAGGASAPTASDMAGAWKQYALITTGNTTGTYVEDLNLNFNGSEDSGTGTLYTALRYCGQTDFIVIGTPLDVHWRINANGTVSVAAASNSSNYQIKDGLMDKSRQAIYWVRQDSDVLTYGVAVKGGQFTLSEMLSGYSIMALGSRYKGDGAMLHGHMDVLHGGALSSTDANQTMVVNGSLDNRDMTGGLLSLEQVDLKAGILANTNMTFPGAGYFTGVRRNDGRMFTGVYHDPAKEFGGLMFIVGAAAQAGPVAAPSSVQEAAALTGMDFANASACGFAADANIATVTSVSAITEHSNSTNSTFPTQAMQALYYSMEMGDRDVAASFPGAPGGYTRITPAWTPSVFRLSNSSAANPAMAVVAWQINAVGTGMQYKRVKEMELYKFKYDPDTGGNRTVAYTLRTADYPGMPVADIPGKDDGHYWITDAAYNKTALEASDYFRPDSRYVIWTVLKDNGAYDSDRDYGWIADPPAGAALNPSSSGSSSGCLFNPLAGFGLEWLLVLLAPALAIITLRRTDS